VGKKNYYVALIKQYFAKLYIVGNNATHYKRYYYVPTTAM